MPPSDLRTEIDRLLTARAAVHHWPRSPASYRQEGELNMLRHLAALTDPAPAGASDRLAFFIEGRDHFGGNSFVEVGDVQIEMAPVYVATIEAAHAAALAAVTPPPPQEMWMGPRAECPPDRFWAGDPALMWPEESGS